MQKKLFVSSLILSLALGHGVMAAGSDMAGCSTSTEAVSMSNNQVGTEVMPVQLTIQDAIYRAFATNPAVKMAGYNLNAARASMNAVRMSRGITITGSLNWDKNGTTADKYSFTTPDSYSQTYGRTRTQGITATLPIYTGGEYRGKLITEKANYQSAISGKQKAYNDMHYNVVNAYYTCLLKKDLERVAQDSVNTLAAHLKNVQASYAVGVVAKVDVLRSEVELADAQQNLIKAENAKKVAVHSLNKIIGLPLETELNLTDTLSNEEYGRDLASCLEFAELNRPDLEQSRQSVRAAKGGVRTARSGYMPKVNVTASKKWTYSSQSQQLGHNPAKSNTWDAGITATWTAFDSGVTAYKVHAAEMKTRAAKEQLRDNENGVALDVRNTYYNMQESQRRIHTTNVAVSKAQEDYDIAQLRYRNGVGTNTDVMDAQVALNKAKTNYIQACYDFNTNKIALDNAIGVPFKSPLEQTVVKPVKMKVRVGDKVKIVEEGKSK